MKNQSGQLAIIGGLVASAMVSVGGAVAWSRASASQYVEAKLIAETTAVSPEPAVVRPLRDIDAIKQAQLPLSSLTRNPFRSGTSVAAKSVAESTRPQLLAAVQNFRLESVLCTDAVRSCTINGKSLAEGDALRPFTVEKINSSSVTLKSGLYRFELRVQQ